jgi:hypothetical protein
MLAGEIADAEQNARSRLELLQRALGLSAKPVQDAEIDLAVVLLSMGEPAKIEEAAKFLKPRVAIPLDSTIADDEQTAIARSVYARALVQSKKPAEAVPHFERAFRTLLRVHSRPNFLIAGCLRDYGAALVACDRKPEGIKALNDAEAELSALSRMRPRYLRISTEQIDAIREQLTKAR